MSTTTTTTTFADVGRNQLFRFARGPLAGRLYVLVWLDETEELLAVQLGTEDVLREYDLSKLQCPQDPDGLDHEPVQLYAGGLKAVLAALAESEAEVLARQSASGEGESVWLGEIASLLEVASRCVDSGVASAAAYKRAGALVRGVR